MAERPLNQMRSNSLVEGVAPAAALLVGFLAAGAWSHERIPPDLRFAAAVVDWLDGLGVHPQHVGRWSHRPLNERLNAATIRTARGYVQVLGFRNAAEVTQIRVKENRAAEASAWTHEVAGLPDAEAPRRWDSGYRWFFITGGNWLIVTNDASTAQTLSATRG